ncbi:MAG: FAD-dependent oxidoreductase, partial [Planctomycetota bacterium]
MATETESTPAAFRAPSAGYQPDFDRLTAATKPEFDPLPEKISPEQAKNIVVIGGGLAGLTSACTLAARGHQVALLEKNEWVGGKAAQHRAEGFRFDMGPTILTLPSVLRRVFAEAGEDLDDSMEMLPLDPQWRCFFEGDAAKNEENTVLDLVSNTDEMKRILTEFTGGTRDAEGYEKFINVSQQLHRVSDKFFFWRSVGGLRDTMEVGGAFSISVLKDVLSLRMGSSVAGVVRKHVPDSRAAQMMDHFTQYVGSSPEASPAVLCGIAHMQTHEGIWYPVGGTRAVPVALQGLAERLGVIIRTSTDVETIETDNAGKRVTAVITTAGERIACDSVVSNCDAVRTYTELLGGTHGKTFQRKNNFEPAC